MRRTNTWAVDGEQHRLLDGKIEVYVPYPVDLWLGCINSDHAPKGVPLLPFLRPLVKLTRSVAKKVEK